MILMTEFTFQTEINASPEKVWEIYSDVKKWFLWEDDLERIALNGEFATGTSGTMKLKGQPEMMFTLISVIPNEEFWDKTEIEEAGLALVFGHTLVKNNDKTIIKHIVRLEKQKGNIEDEEITFLSHVFKDTPQAILALKKVVEAE